MQKPINVLTGLDYWLDNLMCNVPELAMCYHIDGIVQVKYLHLAYQFKSYIVTPFQCVVQIVDTLSEKRPSECFKM